MLVIQRLLQMKDCRRLSVTVLVKGVDAGVCEGVSCKVKAGRDILEMERETAESFGMALARLGLVS